MKCPSCSSFAVVQDQLRGEHICTRCGLVLVERVFELEPEWRREPGEQVGRADVTTGVDLTQHDLGLGSRFELPGDLPPSWRARLRRMQLWQRRARLSSYSEKSLREALESLDYLCEDLSIPKEAKSEVSTLYRKARGARLTLGRNTWHVLAALTFLTCRRRGIFRTEEELAAAAATRAGSDKRLTFYTVRKLSKLFAGRFKLSLPRASPSDYLTRFAPSLGLPAEVIARAGELCDELRESVRKPAPLLAAVAVYLAAEEASIELGYKLVARTMGVGVSSVCRLVRESRAKTRGG